MEAERWHLAGLTLRSRLLVGTARYPSVQVMLDALEASGTELVTVALRRVSLPVAQPVPLAQPGGASGHPGANGNPGGEPENLYQLLQERSYHILPNTAGCYTVKEAVLTAQLGREALGTSLVKLELWADDETLLPDVVQLLEAARALIKDGFAVLPYTNDDPVTAQKLQEVGCAAVMPLVAPIGSGLGIRNPHNLDLMRRRIQVPLIVDAGVGTASDVAIAFELGIDGVLLNSAIARAQDPVRMAAAMRHAALAGREALLAGRMPRRTLADPTSPMAGRVAAGSAPAARPLPVAVG